MILSMDLEQPRAIGELVAALESRSLSRVTSTVLSGASQRGRWPTPCREPEGPGAGSDKPIALTLVVRELAYLAVI